MASNTISILKPSVNNLTVRIFVRAPGSTSRRSTSGEEGNGRVPRQGPRDLTRCSKRRDCRGAPLESCAIMQYCATSTGSTGSTRRIRRARHGRQRDVLPHRDDVSARRARHIRVLNFPQYAGEVGASDADADTKARAQVAAEAAVAGPSRSTGFFLDGKTFIGGDTPSIADIRLAATLEFLRRSTTSCRVGGVLHRCDGVRARRRVHGARGGRARLRRERQGARGGVTSSIPWRMFASAAGRFSVLLLVGLSAPSQLLP